MTDKNWSQIGDEIEDMVRKALESRDFGKLSQDLSRTVGEAMENVGKSVQDAVNKPMIKPGKLRKDIPTGQTELRMPIAERKSPRTVPSTAVP